MPKKTKTAKKAAQLELPQSTNRPLLERWARETPTWQVLEVIEVLSSALRRKEQISEAVSKVINQRTTGESK